jgi:stage II sporulation protein D
MFMFTLISSVYPNNVQAYSNTKIYDDVRVGLVSMTNTQLTAVLTGSYTLNGIQKSSGTVLTIKVSNNLVNVNGVDYSEVQLIPLSTSNLITLTSGSVTNKYQGNFFFKVSLGKILPINSLNIESYLKGVVGYEMSDYYPLEALKAQAVAARNYALVKLGSEAAKGYDFDDTILYQVYKGYDDRLKNAIRAVDETKFIVLLHSDKLVETLYSAWHGGYSEDAVNVWGNSAAYLKAKADSFENDPWPGGNRSLTNAQIDSTLKSTGWLLSTDTFISLDLESITRFASGRVANINIIYEDLFGIIKTKSVTKDKTRSFLGFPSNMFIVSYDAEARVYTFSGKGYGHGLGMSQIGAKNRAASGQTYEQILKFYYDGTYIESLTPQYSAMTLSAVMNKSSTIVGQPVKVSAAAGGGSGTGYLYKYEVLAGSSVIALKEFSSDNSYTYTPSVNGNYSIKVYLKDSSSSSSSSENIVKSVSFTAYKAPQITSAKSTGKMLINNPVDVSANISYGSPSGYTLKYQISLNGRVISERSLSSSSSFSFTPATVGRYTVSLQIKDNISINSIDASKTFDIYIDSTPMKASKLPIKSKMKGTDVRTVQTGLSQLGYKVGTIDGSFGSKTLSAVKSFQKSVRLKATGIVDSATFNAMNNALLKKASAKIITY